MMLKPTAESFDGNVSRILDGYAARGCHYTREETGPRVKYAVSVGDIPICNIDFFPSGETFDWRISALIDPDQHPKLNSILQAIDRDLVAAWQHLHGTGKWADFYEQVPPTARPTQKESTAEELKQNIKSRALQKIRPTESDVMRAVREAAKETFDEMSPQSAMEAHDNVFVRRSGTWTIRFQRREWISMKASPNGDGLDYLRVLLENPGKSYRYEELSLPNPTATEYYFDSARGGRPLTDQEAQVFADGLNLSPQGRQAMYDAAARGSVQEALEQLAEDKTSLEAKIQRQKQTLDNAKATPSEKRAARDTEAKLEHELEHMQRDWKQIEEYLCKGTALGGMTRALPGSQDKEAGRVKKALDRAIAKFSDVGDGDLELYRHLAKHIKPGDATGTATYLPAAEINWYTRERKQ